MEDFLYAYNQPKKFGKYDLFLDGKITANEIVYKHITKYEDGSKEIDNIKLDDKIVELENKLETHFTFDNSYSTFQELEVAFANRKLKDTVIYIVKNENTSDNPDNNDMFNEHIIMGGKLELIGSGSYAKQQADLDKEIADRIADVDAEETRAKETEEDIITKLTTITGYEFDEDLTSHDGNIDSRIKKEILDRTNADTTLDKKIDETNSVLTTQISDITKEGGTIDSKISVAKEELTNKISTLESTIDELKKSIVVLELPNQSINKSSIFTDTEGDNQSYTVLLDMPKGSLIKGNNTTEVKINDETIGNFIFNIDDLGIITSNQQQFSYKLSDEVITTSTTDDGVLQDDGSTLITTTTTTTTTPRQLLITIGISGTHKESTLDISFSTEKSIDQTHTETTTSTETIPPSTEITE